MSENLKKAFPFALPFILDGATGTELSKRGMKGSDCTERFVLEHPEALTGIQCGYRDAGSDAVLAPTFGANSASLSKHGFAKEEASDICGRLFSVTKEGVPGVKIGGDMSPTGLLVKPYGDTEPETVYEIYREQAKKLLECGVDFFFIETMISAAEARLAVQAVRSLSKEIPVFVSLTVSENGRTMYGDVPAAALVTLMPYDIQAFGCNCSIGPEVVMNALTPAAPLAKLYGIPLIAKPNAGMPVTDENGLHFPLSPEDMAMAIEKMTGLGVGVFGGCCGTTAEHVAAIAAAAKSCEKERASDVKAAPDENYAATSRLWVPIDPDAEYTAVDADSEDDLYDLTEDADPDEVLYFELGEGGADLLIRMDAYIANPYALRGDDEEIEKVERALCRKVR